MSIRQDTSAKYSSSDIKNRLKDLAVSGELAAIKPALLEDPRLLTMAELNSWGVAGFKVRACGENHCWWTQDKNEQVILSTMMVQVIDGLTGMPPVINALQKGMCTRENGMRPVIKLDRSKIVYADGEIAIPEAPPAPVDAPKAEVTKRPTANLGLVENDTYQPLLKDPGVAKNGKMVFTLTMDEPTAEDWDNLGEDAWIEDSPTAMAAGMYYISFKAKGTRDGVSYYEDSKPEYVLVEVYSKNKARITEMPTPKAGLVANGQPQELVGAGTSPNGTMVYALGTDSTTEPAEYSTTIPTGTEAGKYFVWFKAKAIPGVTQEDSRASCVAVEISAPGTPGSVKKAEIAVKPEAKTDLKANGQAQELITRGYASGGTMVYALGQDTMTVPGSDAFSEAIPTGKEAGAYYVWYKAKGVDGFADSDAANLVVVIVVDPGPDAVTPTYEPTYFPTTTSSTSYYTSSNSGGGGSSGGSGGGGGGGSEAPSGGSGSSKAYFNKISKTEVEYVMPRVKKGTTKVVVPNTVKIGKKTYKVTAISGYAFIGEDSVRSVRIGKYVKRIDPYAFYGAKNLKTIEVESSLLTAKKIKGCLKDSKVTTVAVMNNVRGKFSLYKKIFSKGNTGAPRNVSVRRR